MPVANPAPTEAKPAPKPGGPSRAGHACLATGKTTGACRGYQIDHWVPLSKSGADSPSNMQWLTTQQHKAKTAQERR